MALLTVDTGLTNAGIDPTASGNYQAADAGGDLFANDGRQFLFCNNGGGGNITLTFEVNQTVNNIEVQDRTVTIDAGKYKIIGPFAQQTFNNGSDQVSVTYSGVTSVSVVALQWG